MKEERVAEGKSPSQLIDARIKELGDWRGETLARVRALIHEAEPDIVEEWKWGVPVFSHDGIITTAEVYKAVVKLTFAKGAALPDPTGLFNSSLGGSVRRAIDSLRGLTTERYPSGQEGASHVNVHGRGETVEDTARVLSRFVHGLIVRTCDHSEVERLATTGSIPVVNALTDLLQSAGVPAMAVQSNEDRVEHDPQLRARFNRAAAGVMAWLSNVKMDYIVSEGLTGGTSGSHPPARSIALARSRSISTTVSVTPMST